MPFFFWGVHVFASEILMVWPHRAPAVDWQEQNTRYPGDDLRQPARGDVFEKKNYRFLFECSFFNRDVYV